MLNEAGGVIDDLIVYFMHETWFRLVVNASTREKDLAWIRQHAAAHDVSVTERSELAMVAVQGPKARELAAVCIADEFRDEALAMKPFFGMEAGELFVARTGYTGEDGWEIAITGRPGGADLGAIARLWNQSLWARCARHAAAGGCDESVWLGHGRGRFAARSRACLDDCLGAGGSQFHWPR